MKHFFRSDELKEEILDNELGLSNSAVSTLSARILKMVNFKNKADITHHVIQKKLIEQYIDN